VDYLHFQNIVHRDLKPGNTSIFILDNILFERVDNQLVVKVADFGLSAKFDNGRL
jgi:serine/threonine protein kinase